MIANHMGKKINHLIKRYAESSGLAALMVSFMLAFLFQLIRLLIGHNDGNTVKILKIITTLVFLVWAFGYVKNNKPTL